MSYSAALLLWIGANAGPAGAVAPPVTEAPIATSEADEQHKRWQSVLRQPQIHRQVRIERRITIRIPRSSSSRLPLSSINQRRLSNEWKEKKIGKCLPMKTIAGVQVSGSNQLLLYTTDRRIIRARLEKVCRARDFYSGFYLEQSADGQLCIDRDILQARSGSKCELERIRQLIPDDD